MIGENLAKKDPLDLLEIANEGGPQAAEARQLLEQRAQEETNRRQTQECK